MADLQKKFDAGSKSPEKAIKRGEKSKAKTWDEEESRSDSESEPALLTCGVKPGRGRSKAARGQADQNRTTQIQRDRRRRRTSYQGRQFQKSRSREGQVKRTMRNEWRKKESREERRVQLTTYNRRVGERRKSRPPTKAAPCIVFMPRQNSQDELNFKCLQTMNVIFVYLK